MTLPPENSLRDAFASAVREHLERNLRTGEDWDRFKTIQRETDARLMTEQATHKRDFSQRMAEAKEIILREESGARLDHPLPSWTANRSSMDALDRKAGERVQQDHERRIAAIKKDELDAFRDLTAEIRARDAPEQTQSLTETWRRSGPTRS